MKQWMSICGGIFLFQDEHRGAEMGVGVVTFTTGGD